jgi:hypothetical protein
MRPIKPNVHRRPLWRTVLLAVLAIVGGGAVTVALLGATKKMDLGSLAFWREKAKPVPDGYVPIYVNVRPIPAHTIVSRDHLIDPKTGTWAVVWVDPREVPKDAIKDMRKIYNRVTARDKPALTDFKEKDLLPEGSKPGIAGGTPLGKRAITLDAAKLKGVHELHEGDHIDLLASVAVDMPGAGHSNSGRSGNNFVAAPDALLLPKRGFVRPLVEDGVVVSPVKIRNAPTTVSSLTQGATTRTVPVQEIVIAVAPEEVRLVAEAIDLKYEITCVARSGRPAPVAQSPPAPAHPSATGVPPALADASSPQPPARAAQPVHEAAKGAAVAADRGAKPAGSGAAPMADVTPGLDPMADYRSMEVMIGNQRQIMLFNGPGSSPVAVSQGDAPAKADASAPTDGPEEKRE